MRKQGITDLTYQGMEIDNGGEASLQYLMFMHGKLPPAECEILWKNLKVYCGQDIAPELRVLLDNVRYWIENKTYPPDEIAVRFHHKLVFIHPFPNGNGRHARLAADILVTQLGQPRLSWGSGNLVAVDELRRRYVSALQSADREDITPLMVFARS